MTSFCRKMIRVFLKIKGRTFFDILEIKILSYVVDPWVKNHFNRSTTFWVKTIIFGEINSLKMNIFFWVLERLSIGPSWNWNYLICPFLTWSRLLSIGPSWNWNIDKDTHEIALEKPLNRTIVELKLNFSLTISHTLSISQSDHRGIEITAIYRFRLKFRISQSDHRGIEIWEYLCRGHR